MVNPMINKILLIICPVKDSRQSGFDSIALVSNPKVAKTNSAIPVNPLQTGTEESKSKNPSMPKIIEKIPVIAKSLVFILPIPVQRNYFPKNMQDQSFESSSSMLHRL